LFAIAIVEVRQIQPLDQAAMNPALDLLECFRQARPVARGRMCVLFRIFRCRRFDGQIVVLPRRWLSNGLETRA
jgi:hypothetical protein